MVKICIELDIVNIEFLLKFDISNIKFKKYDILLNILKNNYFVIYFKNKRYLFLFLDIHCHCHLGFFLGLIVKAHFDVNCNCKRGKEKRKKGRGNNENSSTNKRVKNVITLQRRTRVFSLQLYLLSLTREFRPILPVYKLGQTPFRSTSLSSSCLFTSLSFHSFFIIICRLSSN